LSGTRSQTLKRCALVTNPSYLLLVPSPLRPLAFTIPAAAARDGRGRDRRRGGGTPEGCKGHFCYFEFQHKMEDNQTVATQTSAAQGYASVGYNEYSAVSDTGSVAPIESVDSGADSVYAAQGSSYADVNVDSANVGTAIQDATVNSAYKAKSTSEVASMEEAVANLENTVSETGQPVGYDSVNGGVFQSMNFTTAGVGENGSASNEVGATVMEQRFGGESGISAEEDRLWSIVRANSLDFNAWTALIQESEKENNIQKVRKVYDAFLSEFPLCYGYWKKYADHEGHLGTVDKVVEVYERAVLAVTYSVDIWLHYCEFAMSTYEDPDTIRRLFERGLAYVGTDYLSSPLWDEYIKYEYSQQAWSHVAMIYTRILENPIQSLDRYFNSFKELAAIRPLSEIRTAEVAAMVTANTVTPDQGVEGEVRPDFVEQSTESVSAGLTEAEELEKYIAIREEMYKKAKEFDSKIIGFETAIRRPYFHVRPLDDPELENWHNFLDFIERGDDFNKVVKLYERCLIACANYPEYWIRYVLCMEASGSLELANNALARATQVFVKKQPEIHLFAARFKENNGDVLGARAEYQLLHSEISPGFLEAIVRHANMEYRLGNKEAAFSVYEESIAAERGKELSQVLPMLLAQYSRFLYLITGDSEKAKEVLSGGFEHVQLSKTLIEAIIHLEAILPSPKRIDYLDSLVERFITPSSDNPNAASTADREDLSSIYMEFLDLFGDAQSIKKADTRHGMLFLRHKSTSISRKRRADDYLDSEKTKLAKTYMSSAQSVMGAYPNAQNQWPAGYGNKPPTWPQVPPTQGQQWNPAYAPQAGYSGYGTYGSYPQAATSAPQSTAAYGAYPSAYPAQAYPAQQPAATAAAYAQQQAAAPQAYYSGYY
ncbi:hypothetical protein Taro_013792, partial [Colocasia esculenta]|nr:hypothetical protein [Colocasia esculenta]